MFATFLDCFQITLVFMVELSFFARRRGGGGGGMGLKGPFRNVEVQNNQDYKNIPKTPNPKMRVTRGTLFVSLLKEQFDL